MNVLRQMFPVWAVGLSACRLTDETLYFRESGAADARDAAGDARRQDASGADGSMTVDAALDVTAEPVALDVIEHHDAMSEADSPMETRTQTVRIDFIHDTIAQTGDYYVRLTYPSWSMDGGTTGWSTGHCVGGVRSLGDPRNTDECTLDYTAYPVGTIVEFYPIYARDLTPICGCDLGEICPLGYATYRFTVYIDPGGYVYGVGTGLLEHCQTTPSGLAGVISFRSP